VLVLLGAALRLALWNANPPNNVYDNHLRVVGYYAREIDRPAPDACWQCYQPPLYYAVAAGVLRLSHLASDSAWVAWRSVQLSSVVFSVLQLVVAWWILCRIGAKSYAPRVCALAILVSLPRDLYTAAFVSNDAAVGLLVSVSILLYLRASDAARLRTDWRDLVPLLIAVWAAAWTKQSGLVVAILPLAMVGSAFLRSRSPSGSAPPERRRLLPYLLVAALGLVFAFAEEVLKALATGRFPVSNQHFFDWPQSQPPGTVAGVSFFDFRFVELLRTPTCSPATLDSFWTELFARLWFDYEPKFLSPTEPAALIAVLTYGAGLVVVSLWIFGFLGAARSWRGSLERLPLLAVQLAVLVVPLVQTLRFPHYSSMKAMFLLPAAALATVFLSLGIEKIWRHRLLRLGAVAIASALVLLAASQVVLIALDIENALEITRAEGKLWSYPRLW
jgi:hypothetical protein